MAASVTGLEFNGPLGHAYLVPYGTEAQFIPGYRGLIDLVVRGGGASNVQAHIVYPGDQFDLDLGTTPRIHHRPDYTARKEIEPKDLLEEIVGAYMVARLPDGSTTFDFMPQHEIARRRRMSRAQRSDSPWVVWPDEMIRKTPVRHGIKMLPISNERLQQRLGAAMEFDNRFDTGSVETIIPEFDDAASIEASIQEATASKADELRARLEAQAAATRTIPGAPDFNGSNFDSLPQDQKDAVLRNEQQLGLGGGTE